jgi:hypothetical protein
LVDLTFLRHEADFSKTPFQTVRADFPHTAYRWSLGTLHYALSRKKGFSGYFTVPRRRWSPRLTK